MPDRSIKGIVVISVDIEKPGDWSEIVDAMHLPDVPHVDGDVRIAISEARDRVMEVLDAEAAYSASSVQAEGRAAADA